MCLMVYKALSGLAPSYITELCVPVASIHPRSSLRSAAHGTLFIPRTRLELGKRAFVVAAPAAWNSLPDDIRSAPTLDEFKQCLKTSVHTVILLIGYCQLRCRERRCHFVCKAPL